MLRDLISFLFVCPTWANGSIPHQWENFTFGVPFSSFLSTIINAVLISEPRFRFVNYQAGHENTDVYDLEPMPGTPHTHLEYIDSQGELDKLCIEDLVFSGDDSRINFCVKFIVNRYSNISTGTEKHDITVFNTIYIYDLGQENISRGYTLAD